MEIWEFEAEDGLGSLKVLEEAAEFQVAFKNLRKQRDNEQGFEVPSNSKARYGRES